jgi:uncharacterized membrane protein
MISEKNSKILINILKFFLPFIIGLSILLSVGVFIIENLQLRYWSLISAYFFPPLGKETIIPSGILLGIDPLVMALSIAFVDIIVALFLVWNYDLAKKIPIIGKFITKVESIGRKSSNKYSWIKPLKFIGIILFVMVPFQGSGGLVGSIVGRLVGIKPWNIFIAISLGATIGCILIAYFTDIILTVFVSNILIGLLIVIIILIIFFMIFAYKKSNKKKNN